MWWIYAILSALFAALTAIFAKLGVANVNANLALTLKAAFGAACIIAGTILLISK